MERIRIDVTEMQASIPSFTAKERGGEVKYSRGCCSVSPSGNYILPAISVGVCEKFVGNEKSPFGKQGETLPIGGIKGDF